MRKRPFNELTIYILDGDYVKLNFDQIYRFSSSDSICIDNKTYIKEFKI